jgi:hypothetical protein
MEEPVKRRGRPPKAKPEEPKAVLTQETVERVLKQFNAEREAKPALPGDDRIGRYVGHCEHITFEDDMEYRVEDGVIAERVR